MSLLSLYDNHILTDAQSSTGVGTLTPEALNKTLMAQWGPDFQDAKIVTTGDRYTSWLEYFIRFNLGYGTVSAWAQAVLRRPSLFLGIGSNPKWRLYPSQFGEYCELQDGSTYIHEPEIDRDGNIILRDDINFARRVWDVRANRVIPACWVPQAILEPVSHAWVSPAELQYIWSPINYMQWNIPIPRGSTLEAVRAELLQLRVEYSWLDVLCLRQAFVAPGIVTSESPWPWRNTEALVVKSEERRAKEWPTDVPLIGGIYKYSKSKVIVYLNGLGKLYDPKVQAFSERHWLRRAWTLQETVGYERTVIAGVHPLSSNTFRVGSVAIVTELISAISHKFGSEILNDIAQMAPRHATNPLDKESCDRRIPKYDESKTEEEAWGHLLHAGLGIQGLDGYSLTGDMATQLIGSFPHDSSSEHWFPSWKSVLSWPTLVKPHYSSRPSCDISTIPPKFDLSIPVMNARLYKSFAIRRVTKNANYDTHLYSLGGSCNVFNLSKLPDGTLTSFIELAPVGESDANIEKIVGHTLRDDTQSSMQYVILLIGALNAAPVHNYFDLGWMQSDQGVGYTLEFSMDTARYLVCQDITALRPTQGPCHRTYLKVLNCFHCTVDPKGQLPRRGELSLSRESRLFESKQAVVHEANRLLYAIEMAAGLVGSDITESDLIYLE